jgi:hypothetical protein
MRIHAKISVYWLWLLVIGGLCLSMPVDICWDYWQRLFDCDVSTGWFDPLPSVADLYRDAICGYNDFHGLYGQWILLHATVSVLFAIVATVIHHACAKRCQPERQPDSKTFTLRSLLLTVTAIACVFSLFACLGAIYALYLVVLIFCAGRFAVLLLAAKGL